MIINNEAKNLFWYAQWTTWFAWKPVRLNANQVAWLCWLERRDSAPLNDTIVWEYRMVPA